MRVREGGVHARVSVRERNYFIRLCYWSLSRLKVASPDICN